MHADFAKCTCARERGTKRAARATAERKGMSQQIQGLEGVKDAVTAAKRGRAQESERGQQGGESAARLEPGSAFFTFLKKVPTE